MKGSDRSAMIASLNFSERSKDSRSIEGPIEPALYHRRSDDGHADLFRHGCRGELPLAGQRSRNVGPDPLLPLRPHLTNGLDGDRLLGSPDSSLDQSSIGRSNSQVRFESQLVYPVAVG